MISKSLVLTLLTLLLVASCSFNDFNSYPYSQTKQSSQEDSARTPASDK
ncbi:hypothetical protein C8D79_0791 [Bacteriovorax stolpii]|nr:hypothetical protein [Bacteriovorax stolpii]TDP55734.1 hypothetical protein C8D79_0791 [Bacteriovorax stolpii]